MKVGIKVIAELDPKWADNFKPEELKDYIRDRLQSSMGFRVQRITRLEVGLLKEEKLKLKEKKG